ncbi:hypothetical protein BJ912DRAFT_1067492 [Pholiota molesta]|nr:hypothetical protein BJ912DRAFT_1067492 [Pholiota molesta]
MPLPTPNSNDHYTPPMTMLTQSFEGAFDPITDPEWMDPNWMMADGPSGATSIDTAVEQEERDYQTAIARSLGSLGNEARSLSLAASSSTTIQSSTLPATATALHQPSQEATSSRRRAPITKQMNSDWMRPFEDNTKRSPLKKKQGYNPDQQFRLVFWAESDKPSNALAIHECPDWPTWSLMDAPDVRELLDVSPTDRLQFYDVTHSQWVICLPSYPHDVSKSRHLLLRHLNVSCFEFEKHLAILTELPTHLWWNMPAERATIKKQLQQTRHTDLGNFSDVIDLSDDDHGAALTPVKRKADCENDEVPIARRRRLSSPLPAWMSDSTMLHEVLCASPSSLGSPSMSPPLVGSSVCSVSLSTSSALAEDNEILVPSGKKWPAGMYTVHMARGFRNVDCEEFKRLKLPLPERIFLRHWKRASEHQREAVIMAGQSAAGLWSAFPRKR